MSGKIIEVLMIEDDPGDVRLTEESLKESKLHINLNTVSDGKEGLEYLRKEGKYKDATEPDIVLLDLNMPKMDGRQVLAEMKNDEKLKLIPVIILTTSAEERDIEASYSKGANCYITKPVDFDQFQKIVKEISNFWFSVVKLPKHKE